MAKTHDSSSVSKRKRRQATDGGASSADESVASTSSAASTSSSKVKKHSRKRREKEAALSDAESSGGESSSSAGSTLSPSSSSSRSKKSKKHTKHLASSSLVSAPLSSAFEIQYPILTLSIPPIHAHNPTIAVGEQLDSLVMRFVPPLNGVLVSHGQSYFLVDEERTGSRARGSALIDGDGAFATSKVAVECCVWRPRVGMKLRGAISLEAPSHVSVLVHETFNASIPSSHMGKEWHWVHRSEHDEEEVDGSGGVAGYWERKETGERLGSHVEFVVIGLTILANVGGGGGHTLALCGSLLDRPFSLPPPSTAQQGFGGLVGKDASAGARATRMGFGDFTGGAGEGAGDTGVAGGKGPKSTRRVRWEGEESDDDDGEEHDDGAANGKPTRPATIKASKGGSHVKF